jgi:hypothetical protein
MRFVMGVGFFLMFFPALKGEIKKGKNWVYYLIAS